MSDGTEWLGEAKGDPVVLAEPDPRWTGLFEEFRGRLAGALGDVAIRIDHVGSTALFRLPAKPVIDIQVSVADVGDEDSYRPAIESLGWPLRAREPDHRFFRPPSKEERVVHVHVCSSGSQWERDHLLFVAFLKAHPARTDAYARLKRDLATRFASDRTEYTNAKDGFITQTLVLAEDWVKSTGWEP